MFKIEFSKLILIIAYITAVTFTVVAAWLGYFGADLASFSNIVLVIWGLVTTGVGFYYWKAKAENIIKISQNLPENIKEHIDSVKNLLE